MRVSLNVNTQDVTKVISFLDIVC